MNRRPLAALLVAILAAPSGAFAGFEKETLPQSLAPAAAVGVPALPASPLPARSLAAPAQAPVSGVASLAQDVAAQVQVIARPSVSAESSSQAGENATRILQGGQAEPGGSAVDAAAPAQVGSALPAASEPSSSRQAQPPAPPSAPKGPAAVDGRSGYALRRAVLSVVSSLFGVSYSLPPAGPRLTRKLLARAASKQFVISDFDDTLAPHNSSLSPESAAAIVALRRAGKGIAVVTVRPSVNPRPTDVTILTSLSTIAPADRAGIIAGSLQDGYIVQYDAEGEAKPLYQEPPFSAQENQAIREAAQVVTAQLSEFGTEKGIEFLDPMKYIMAFKTGTPESAVVALAARFEAELAKRGLTYRVEPRLPKDPTKAPYMTFGKIDKSHFIEKLAQLEGIKPRDALILGDSMYKPKTGKDLGLFGRWADRLARRLSGAPMPLTGNEDDRNMESALPGALTLSVGGTADASMKNGYVLETKGPSMSLRVLQAVASRPAKTVVAEYRALLKERDFQSRWISESGADLSRAGREFWARLIGEREDLDRRIAELEARFPSLSREKR